MVPGGFSGPQTHQKKLGGFEESNRPTDGQVMLGLAFEIRNKDRKKAGEETNKQTNQPTNKRTK